ncbi:MAG TPA: STAS/SEC14 domain-containing protein [Bacteroidota bacterium]|nr:STAS/SEC14 domain-containing protein [Bacteroidota bacterium]
MASEYEFAFKGKKIFCLDLSGLQLSDKQEFRELVRSAKAKIQTHTPKSLLVITNITNTGFDTEAAAIIGDYAISNSPYVKASTVVGAAGMQKVIINSIKVITGREFFLADSMEEAQEWLVNQ